MITPVRKPSQILILGASFDTGNMGVSALAAGAIKCAVFQFPEARVSLLDYGKESKLYRLRVDGTEISVPLINIRFSKKFYLSNNIALLLLLALLLKAIPSVTWRQRLIARNRTLRQIYAADVVAAISGGDSFSDIYGLQRLLYVSFPQILAILLGKDLVLLPQTIGPFRGRVARAVSKYILRRAARTYARDYQSLKEIEAQIGNAPVKQKPAFCYDIGFGLDPIAPTHLDILGLSRSNRASANLVGLNLSGLLWMGGYTQSNMFGLRCNYQELMRELIDLLIVRLGCNVLLVPHVFGTNTNRESDSAVCEKVFAELEEKYPGRLGWVRGELNQSEIKHVIGSCGFFIGSRMHACIAALSQSVPAVSIAYSDKFISVMKTLGVEGLVLDSRTMSAAEIVQAIAEAFRERASTRRVLKEKLPEVRRTVLNLFSFLDTSQRLPQGLRSEALSLQSSTHR
jgi:polysaccharide pyruvyl transferase WcaK-like protein